MNTNKDTAEEGAQADGQEAPEAAKKFLDFDDFNQFYEAFSKTIKETVGSSSKIPIRSNELDYYMTFPSFKSFVTQQNDRILKIMGNLMKQQSLKKSTNIASSRLDDDERMDILTDSNDQMIEKLGIQLDEIQGLRKKTETELKLSVTSLQTTSRNIKTSWNQNMGMVVNRPTLDPGNSTTGKAIELSSGFDPRADHTKKIVQQKPQKFFQDKLDNSLLPFVSKLRSKPNALRKLPDIFARLDDPKLRIDQELFEKHPELLENPYTYEIEQFEPAAELLEEVNISASSFPASLDQTPFKYIDTVEGLTEMCEQLGKSNRSKIKEIAVDLEHHSYRSFLGFTCLMQISTRTNDYVIDTIKLRAELHRLNEIFTDSTLLKVFHGGDFDIEWLQKDFGIYVVNMFDTGQATRVLQHPHHSLSYLLQHFCQITAQKQYQLADWRMRPLRDEMLKYAREDTHYLLFIYDQLRNELLSKGKNQQGGPKCLLKQVYENSKLICRKTYKKPQFYSKGFLMLCQNNAHLNHKQTKALNDLYAWRDRMARDADESCDYVLKNHQLLKIAELLPREIHGILALCNPVTSMLEASVHELHEIVKNAREFRGIAQSNTIAALSEAQATFVPNIKKQSSLPEIEQTLLNMSKGPTALDSIVHLTTYDPDSILNCPHDRVHNSENQSEEAMQTDQQISNIENIDMKSLLIKPSRRAQNEQLDQAIGLVPIDSNPLGDLLRKDASSVSLAAKSQRKNLKKVEEKVLTIKESIRNPFEMFMPPELRTAQQTAASMDVKAERWNLLKPVIVSATQAQFQSVQASSAEEPAKDPGMIPLKTVVRSERHASKKMNKQVLKNVDFTDAIIEYNRSKAEANKIVALGSEDMDAKIEPVEEDDESNENNNLMAQKIRAGLKTLAHSVTGPAQTSAFSYDDESVNNLFTKAREKLDEGKKSQAKDKRPHSNANLHKKRITNSVTRSKNNKTMTYKPS